MLRLGVGRGTQLYFACPGERDKLEMLMAAADWSDGSLSLSVIKSIYPDWLREVTWFSDLTESHNNAILN